MVYIVTFLEGIITFISPCLLPMLPIYVSYFAGRVEDNESSTSSFHIFSRAIAFVLGFTLLFVLMGALAGTIGKFFSDYQTIVNIVNEANGTYNACQTS
mgnify:CR=1 FL=1